MRERNEVASLKMFRELLWYDIKIRNDTLDPRLQACLLMMTSKRENSIYRLVRETLFDRHVSHKTDVLMMMDSCVSERERERNEVCFIEDAYRWWHQEEKLCTSKMSSLVRETLFHCHGSQKTAVLMMMDMNEREKWSSLHWRREGLLWCDIKIDALDPRLQACPWWWHQEEKLCTSKISILVGNSVRLSC